MTKAITEEDRSRLRTELGFQDWDALHHFSSYGDFLGMNESNYRGAIAEYEKAWGLLVTPWQRQGAGADILEAIADYAIRSKDAELASETLQTLVSRADEIDHPSLHTALAELSLLAGKT